MGTKMPFLITYFNHYCMYNWCFVNENTSCTYENYKKYQNFPSNARYSSILPLLLVSQHWLGHWLKHYQECQCGSFALAELLVVPAVQFLGALFRLTTL